MCQDYTVSPQTLDVLKTLSNFLPQYYLAGGTALALYFNHRQSDEMIAIAYFSEADQQTDPKGCKVS